jgi:hypothetical protein
MGEGLNSSRILEFQSSNLVTETTKKYDVNQA